MSKSTITPDLTLSNKTRVQRSVHDYIGTLPENPIDNRQPALDLSANPQSRYQVTENIANQTEAIYKFDTAAGRIRRRAVSNIRARSPASTNIPA